MKRVHHHDRELTSAQLKESIARQRKYLASNLKYNYPTKRTTTIWLLTTPMARHDPSTEAARPQCTKG
ncbi:MAG: hypothetical protein IPN98_18315 [Propionivibrio sp.]|nr:hypothetical protein [Propionivibrio sp.]